MIYDGLAEIRKRHLPNICPDLHRYTNPFWYEVFDDDDDDDDDMKGSNSVKISNIHIPSP
jgi:hypothetical protein